jgi:hypothetical protein
MAKKLGEIKAKDANIDIVIVIVVEREEIEGAVVATSMHKR